MPGGTATKLQFRISKLSVAHARIALLQHPIYFSILDGRPYLIVSIVKPEHIKAGIYFRPYKYSDKYYGKITLFPELHLSDDSISSILRGPYGALHTRGDIEIQTSGSATFTASMHSGGRTDISAKNVKFETQTFDREVITQRTFESASGGSLCGSKTREIKTQWEKLTVARDPVIISTGKGLGICLQKGQTADFKGVVARIGGDLKVENGNFKLTPLMVTEVSVNEEGSYVIPQYLKTIIDANGDAEIDVDVFENNGSEIHVTGKMKIKADRIAQAVLHQQYLAGEKSGASQSLFSSRVRHKKCYAQRISLSVMTAGDLDMMGNVSISLEGLVASDRDIRISSGGNVAAASRAFYQTLDYTEKAHGPFSHATFRRFVSAPQIVPTFFRANRDFILNALGDYYQTGVQSEIVGNKVVNARNIVSRSLRVERQEVTSGDITNISIGLPSSLTGFSFSEGTISSTARQILEMPPLFQSVHSLLNARTAAQRGSALVQTGLAAHSTLKEIVGTISSDVPGFDSAIEFGARLFGFGDFGISHTHMHQSMTARYGIPSVDHVTGDLEYHAADSAKFIGHQAYAQNITLTGGQTITVLPDVEEVAESVSQRTSSFGYNVITENARGSLSGMNGTNVSTMHHPSLFVGTGINTFRAPGISMTNPLLKAQQNRFIGETEFATLYDVNRSYGSSYNVGLSLSGGNGFSLRGNIGGGRNHSYSETAPLAGVEGDVTDVGSLKNDSVPVTGEVRGNYSFSFRAPVNENHGWGVSFSDINLSSSEAFSQSFTRAVKAGLFGYAGGRLAQAAGLGDFASSLIGSLASAYVSADGASPEGLTSLGHISESRNGHELEIEVIGFNPEQFKEEIAKIKRAIFEEAVAKGATPDEAMEIAEERQQKFVQDFNTEKAKIEETSDVIEQTGKQAVEEIKAEIGEAEVAKLAGRHPVSKDTRAKISTVVNKFKNDLIRKRDKMNLLAPLRQNVAEQASLKTRNRLFKEAIGTCDAILTEIGEITTNSGHEIQDFCSNVRLAFDHPRLAKQAVGDLIYDAPLRAFFEHIDMVPGATKELAQDAWQKLKNNRDLNAFFNHIDMAPGALIELCDVGVTKLKSVTLEDVKSFVERGYNSFKQKPIENSAKAVANISSLFVGGGLFKTSKEATIASFEKNAVSNFSSYNLPWTTWRKYQKVVINGVSYAKIGDRLYTEHAIGRTLPSGLGRNANVTKEGMSISPNVIEHVIRNGNPTEIIMPSGVKRTIYSLGTVEACTENNGKLIVTVNSLKGKGK